MPALEMKTLLEAVTKPHTEKKGGATQSIALQQNANEEGGKEPRHNSGHPCRGLPILTMNNTQDGLDSV